MQREHVAHELHPLIGAGIVSGVDWGEGFVGVGQDPHAGADRIRISPESPQGQRRDPIALQSIS